VRIASKRIGIGMTLALALSACAAGQPRGYAEGVEFAELMLEMTDPQMLQEGNDNDLFRQGACEPQSYAVPADQRQGFMEGCMDTFRSAS
jgi:hypothetical protein